MSAEEIMVPKGNNNSMIALCKFAITYGDGCDIIEPTTAHKNECVDTIIKICKESNGLYHVTEIKSIAGRHTFIEILANDNLNENITFHTYIHIRVWALWAWVAETNGKPNREFVIDGYGSLIEAINKSGMLKAYTKDSYDPKDVKISTLPQNECIYNDLL